MLQYATFENPSGRSMRLKSINPLHSAQSFLSLLHHSLPRCSGISLIKLKWMKMILGMGQYEILMLWSNKSITVISAHIFLVAVNFPYNQICLFFTGVKVWWFTSFSHQTQQTDCSHQQEGERLCYTQPEGDSTFRLWRYDGKCFVDFKLWLFQTSMYLESGPCPNTSKQSSRFSLIDQNSEPHSNTFRSEYLCTVAWLFNNSRTHKLLTTPLHINICFGAYF